MGPVQYLKGCLFLTLVPISLYSTAQKTTPYQDTIPLDSLFVAEDTANFTFVYFNNRSEYKNHKLYSGIAFYINAAKDTIFCHLDSGYVVMSESYYSGNKIKSKGQYSSKGVDLGYFEYYESGKVKLEIGYCDGQPKFRKWYSETGVLTKEERMDYNCNSK